MANLEHKNITNVDLHEPKDINSAAVDTVYVSDGAGSGTWKIAPTPVVLFQQTADKTVIDTVTETTLLATGVGTMTLPANIVKVGSSFRINMQGRISDTATPTLEFKIKLGGITVVSTGAITLGAVSDDHWILIFTGVVRSVGTTGTLMGTGTFLTEQNDHFGLTVAAPITIDTTVDQVLDVTVTWGTANVSNTITSQTATVFIN